MISVYDRIKDKRVVMFGVGIIQADLIGLFDLNIAYYVCDMIETTGDVMLEDVPLYSSDHLHEENPEDLFVIVCENDESYAGRVLESMGFQEDQHYCFGEDLLFEYAYTHKLPAPNIIWGTGGTYWYHYEDIESLMPQIQSFVLSDVPAAGDVFQGRPVVSFDQHEKKDQDFILVCSIYYKEIGNSLRKSGYVIGKNCINIRTYIKLAKYARYTDAAYQIDDRSTSAKNLVVILSGYKPLVWDAVFPRLKAYIPKDFDVVVMTSGKVCEDLRQMCRNYGWSYASTEINHVSLVLNLAILLFPYAKRLWKIDEDIFVTRGCFEAMAKTYDYIEANTRYEVGFVTPLLNVNGYGYVRLLECTGSVDKWESRFGELRYTDCYTHHVAIHDSPDAAKFMWGEGNPVLGDIDQLGLERANAPFEYTICPVRYSIGFILFSRQNWKQMDMFPVSSKMNLGSDEEHICKYCLMNARVMVSAENAVAGHLSYGPQHRAMEEYYKNNYAKFAFKGPVHE
ncbi:hypothetical protein [Desulfitobacterium hafniense]|uniref:Uncharacterized protein n=1 Tax=Desulfitobacterium hafniense (strain Y51) TaxID=138119 RepID=Q24T38_DESHY|nr:hypothetical protein [Desulfitobacterium hafniense]BAE84804.1 hypothetical protein DSY3015 [Desulfitobacterium hafniense Y51]